MSKGKNLLILGGNSKKNILWMKKMKEAYSIDYHVDVIEYDNWYHDGRINFDDELNKISNIVKEDKEYIIVAKSIGILLSVMAMKRKIINPRFLIFMGVPLKFLEEEKLEVLDSLLELRFQKKMLLIQQENDPQCSSKELANRLQGRIPLLTVEGNNHAYNDIKPLKKYIDEFIKLNTGNDIKIACGNNMEEVICQIDKKRKYYKYYNNWLSDPNHKILIFQYQDSFYIAKRISEKRALLEIKNSKLLKEFFENNYSNKYKYTINIPSYYAINSRNGYLVTKYYGADFNQSFYDKSTNENDNLDDFVSNTFQLLISQDIRYNGFLPRNIIFDNDNIFLIDFEDINRKSNIAVETTVKIGWSYFLQSDFSKTLDYNLSFEDDFAALFKKHNLKYKNPYYVALVAESSNGDGFKMDDVINVLSPYLSMEIEVLLDILLYEINIGNVDSNLKERLYSLSQEIRVVELVESKSKLRMKVIEDINKIIMEIKKNCNLLELQRYIDSLFSINNCNIYEKTCNKNKVL